MAKKYMLKQSTYKKRYIGSAGSSYEISYRYPLRVDPNVLGRELKVSIVMDNLGVYGGKKCCIQIQGTLK